MNNLLRSNYQQHPYHLLFPSPWPVVVSLSLLSLALTLAFTMHGYIGNINILYLSFFVLTLSSTFWFRDIIAEALYLGDHTIAVRKGLNIGFLLFVVSEIMIFVSLFWAYLHSAISPDVILGALWPPVGIQAVQPLELPLLNTIILLSSGATITWSHHSVIANNRKHALISLIITLWLIVIFVICQFFEYLNALFTISDGVFGTLFYAATGLHFLHMVMLIVMLSICYWRLRNYQLTINHHVGFETLILYCHVLDVIWLFLYILLYWWGV